MVTNNAVNNVPTITGDSGVASLANGTITVYTNNASTNCGASVKFVASGSTNTLNVTDSNGNTFIGGSTGNTSLTGLQNVGVGSGILAIVTSGAENVCVGHAACTALRSGSDNCAIGYQALDNLDSGSNNIALGKGAASFYTTSESSNIIIGNIGTAAESNVIRIGTQGSGSGQQNKCFIAGIEGVSVSNKQYVTVNTSTGQLGSDALSTALTVAIQVFTSNGTYTPTAGMQYCVAEIWGGGGAGGGAQAGASGQASIGSGGGAGEHSVGVFSAATIGASQSVTIGAGGTGVSGANGNPGGDTSLGALISAKGGTGGGNAGPNTSVATAGGAGGSGGSGGSYRNRGANGGYGNGSFAAALVTGGPGGNSNVGSGGNAQLSGGAAGNAASNYASGGGGATTFNGGGAQTGGAGSAGLVVITEYIIV